MRIAVIPEKQIPSADYAAGEGQQDKPNEAGARDQPKPQANEEPPLQEIDQTQGAQLFADQDRHR